MIKKIIGILIFAGFLVGCGGQTDEFGGDSGAGVAVERPSEPQPVGDDVPISRGLVARMIALTFASPTEIDRTPRVINFNDTFQDDWFDRYINKAYYLGYLGGGGENFYPHQPLTLQQAQTILDRLDAYNPINIQLTDENRNLPISYALWVSLYMQMLENIGGLAGLGLGRLDAVVLITPEFNGNLPQSHIITNLGHFSNGGINFENYLDVQMGLLVRGREILANLGVVSETPVLRNVFIANRTADTLTIFAGGAGRTYAISPEIAASLPEGHIGDVALNGQNITFVQIFNERMSGVVKEIYGNYIEIEGIGRVATHRQFAVYCLQHGSVALGRTNQITIGYDVADFVMRGDGGEIAAALILRRAVPSHIRVVLSTTGFGGHIHNTVELRSADGLNITNAAGETSNIAPNEIFRLSYQNAHLLGGGRVVVEPAGGSKIEILSISRNWPGGASPQYRGILEISGRGGGFIIVNQLLLEEYLYAVIPSEMPTSFGLEAAKVQAVTARSYAYNQFFANRFQAYGANMDDSVMTQVFNNIPETEIARQAVDATRGIFLTYNGRVVSANYFSTSSGHTADRGDVWINFETGNLDAATPGYLRGVSQHFGGNFGDLSNEVNAATFFKNTEIRGYDDQSPWFRWNFELSNEQLTRIINNNLPNLSGNNPHLFGHVSYIGNFQSMEVINRGRGGNVNELAIHGTAASMVVRTEYQIRRLLTPQLPEGILLHRHANSAPINNHFILPSTFMVFEETTGGLRFYGGGFGHGVGMSQHGAFGMVSRGYDFRQILAHFYPGTSLEVRN